MGIVKFKNAKHMYKYLRKNNFTKESAREIVVDSYTEPVFV